MPFSLPSSHECTPEFSRGYMMYDDIIGLNLRESIGFLFSLVRLEFFFMLMGYFNFLFIYWFLVSLTHFLEKYFSYWFTSALYILSTLTFSLIFVAFSPVCSLLLSLTFDFVLCCSIWKAFPLISPLLLCLSSSYLSGYIRCLPLLSSTSFLQWPYSFVCGPPLAVSEHLAQELTQAYPPVLGVLEL